MNIEIKKSVKDYLHQKNVQDIYIAMDNRGGCCTEGAVYVPIIKLGKPANSGLYDLFKVDDITFYFPKKINNAENENITIKLRNILGHKSLVVSGLLGFKY
ncbi:MAG TPA: CC/Se motif family (seleno)protein [Acetobacterium sp.]|uniref:CC/Se motif family (seleno)protein n=1 Tax=Acetobacterium sp. TaxID=1872094 RepID=UPI002F401685